MTVKFSSFTYRYRRILKGLKSYFAVLILFVSMMSILNSRAYAAEYNETQIKLAFILKVLDFVDSFPGDKNNLTFCLYGFEPAEYAIVKSDLNNSKQPNINLINNPSMRESRLCSIMFFHNNFQDYQNILDYTKNGSILTFAEIKYFADEGGMVEFYKHKGKYRFIINNELAIKQNILFNAKLLEISK